MIEQKNEVLPLQQKENLRHFLYLAQVVEARDPYTAGHLWRVAQFTKLLGKALGVKGVELFNTTLGAYLHDFGKIIVPDHILNKTEKLKTRELQIMQSHSEAGYLALSEHELTREIAFLARYHHESWDGKGYPNSLNRDKIPFGARIVGVTDAFDAMTSNRPYRKSMSLDNAKTVMKQSRGTQFDPDIVDVFLQLDEHELKHIIGHSDQGKSLLVCKQCGPVIEKPDADVSSAYCRVCTGKFDVFHYDDGNVEVEFNGDHGNAVELLSKPDMRHIESNFAEFGL